MVCHEMAFLPPSDQHQYYFQNNHHQLHHEELPPHSINHDFHGGQVPSLTMMDHHHQQQQHQQQLRSPVLSGCGHGGPGDDHDDLSDDGSHMMLGEKKKRLSLEQVKTLEKTFELGNKLDPERKLQLAKALGLKPRQVAIWFQNRRARWKTKQLEKDYNLLKRQFDALKSDNDNLLSNNNKLHSQLLALKSGNTDDSMANKEGTEMGSINLNATTKSYCWSNNGSEISSDINLGISTTTPEESPSSNKLQFSSSFLPSTSLTDLLTNSSSTPKNMSDHPHQQIQDESFCSLFGGGGAGGSGGVGEQPPFWTWAPDQHHLQ